MLSPSHGFAARGLNTLRLIIARRDNAKHRVQQSLSSYEGTEMSLIQLRRVATRAARWNTVSSVVCTGTVTFSSLYRCIRFLGKRIELPPNCRYQFVPNTPLRVPRHRSVAPAFAALYRPLLSSAIARSYRGPSLKFSPRVSRWKYWIGET